MTDKKYVWVIRKESITASGYKAKDIDGYLKKREVVNITPKGMRLKMSEDWISFHPYERYDFFETERAALEFIANEANKVAGELNDIKLTYTSLLCEAHDTLNKLKFGPR
jgi:hypothetical protein